MDSEILKSVIEITGQRDLDSMDYCLVATLGELLPATAISLLKLRDEERLDSLEAVAHLDLAAGKEIETCHAWTEQVHPVDLDAPLERCLTQGQTVTLEAGEQQEARLLMPIMINNKASGALEIRSDQNLHEHSDLISGLLKIYANYNVILVESERDNLTGLLNRRTFDSKLSRLLAEQRGRSPADPQPPQRQRREHPDCNAWLALIDIDHFKRINDRYGHVYGDEILLLFSQQMRRQFRRSDLLFRVGGEEFVVILSPVSAVEAGQTLERFRQAIAEHRFPQVDLVTASVGYEQIAAGDYPRQIFDLADKALYFAKENGRNCVHRYRSLVDAGDLIDEDKSGSIELF